jgi:hypothetical protein
MHHVVPLDLAASFLLLRLVQIESTHKYALSAYLIRATARDAPHGNR